MEYTPGQPIEYRLNDMLPWRSGKYIGRVPWLARDGFSNFHALLSECSDVTEVDGDDLRPAPPTREERIESLIDDYVFAAVDFGLSLELGGDDACSRRAALFAILDAEVPE